MSRSIKRHDGQIIDLQKYLADSAFPTNTLEYTTGTINANSSTIVSVTFVNKALLSHILCFATNSTDFDLEFYEKASADGTYRIYRNIDNAGTLSDLPVRQVPYRDEDGTSKLHFKLLNNDLVNNSNFTIRIKYIPVYPQGVS